MTWILAFAAALALAAPKANKDTCAKREIERRDCRLNAGTYNLRLTSETIARDDGTWHTVDPMPLKGEGVTWEKGVFEIHHGWPILQLWIWDTGSGEAKVQQLHWYVADAQKGELKILKEGIVRRRRMKPADPEDEAAKKAKPEFIYDKWEKHSLKPRKDGKLEWNLNSETILLDKAGPHGI